MMLPVAVTIAELQGPGADRGAARISVVAGQRQGAGPGLGERAGAGDALSNRRSEALSVDRAARRIECDRPAGGEIEAIGELQRSDQPPLSGPI